ncbi:MAG: rhomboid family intramembrane serine protease [Candidatus Rhabdochlamydia sp.]
MRLLAEFQQEKEALHFQLFLQKEGIEAQFDPTENPVSFRLWVIDEDAFTVAQAYYERYRAGDLTFTVSLKKRAASLKKQKIETPSFHTPLKKIGESSSYLQMKAFSLTKLLIALCIALFVASGFQIKAVEKQIGPIAANYPFLPIQKQLLFDYPQYLEKLEHFLIQNEIRDPSDLKSLSLQQQVKLNQIEQEPTWQGVLSFISQGDLKDILKFPAAALFSQIKQGNYWRLITPVLLHASFLHIFFNMTWLLMLGTQIEMRIGPKKYLLLSLFLGIFSNVAQYIVSGPIFIGYSGIITGMFGFIWSRQKVAPQERYPLQKNVITAMAGFVLVMFALEVVMLMFQFLTADPIDISIANTAHLTGGVVGIVLGRLPFFATKIAK